MIKYQVITEQYKQMNKKVKMDKRKKRKQILIVDLDILEENYKFAKR